MTDQGRTVQDVLKARLAVTQELSAATAEHLRLSQSICGIEVLEMGGIGETDSRMQRERSAVDICEAKISRLEQDMAELDKELTELTNGDTT